jgi:hypothetical protein
VVGRHDLLLSDPADSDSRQPYHAALERPESEAAKVVSRVTRSVKALGLRGLRTAAEELAAGGYALVGVGIVAGSVSDPAGIANPHIRAHALEGKLFREAIEDAARALGLRSTTLVEKSLYDEGARALGRDRSEIERALQEIGRAAGRPWRGEEKAAALAAWMEIDGRR